MFGTTTTCQFCGRPCPTAVWVSGLPYHEECTHGPAWSHGQPVQGLTELQAQQVRQIVSQEIERLKDQIENALGARPR